MFKKFRKLGDKLAELRDIDKIIEDNKRAEENLRNRQTRSNAFIQHAHG